MFCKCFSAFIDGISSIPVTVEADISNGMPGFEMVGLLSCEVREAKERVLIAFKNSDIKFPPKHITINISPASIRKVGTAFDLPIAAVLLGAFDMISHEDLESTLIVGELSLDGSVKRVKGILPIVSNALNLGIKRCIVPKDNVKEASVIKGIEIVGISSVRELVDYLLGKIMPNNSEDTNGLDFIEENSGVDIDFKDISGQEGIIIAVAVAVCGMHNILMTGPPGCGKTMIARRVPTIMPSLTQKEVLEVSGIYSAAGLLNEKNFLVVKRPFRSPHHMVTANAITGGGTYPKPGEISLASKGVLFLDELPEFSLKAIEALRQPLEEKCIDISRINGNYRFPADFMLVAARNPCKCGYYPDRNRCNCSENEVARYLGRISRPIMDRIDIFSNVEPVSIEDMGRREGAYTSKDLKIRIEKARRRQKNRFEKEDISFNSQMSVKQIKKYCKLSSEGEEMLKKAYDKYKMTARGYYKILKVARSVADFEDSEEIETQHIALAISYRI